jgi:predicted DNA-binding WGR domain protein
VIKLYKKQDGVLYYWETWNRTPKNATIHWGVVGERGSVETVRATSQVKFAALIQEKVNEKRAEGYAESSTETLLEIEYEAKTMSPVRLKKLHRLCERLDQLMGWTGLGYLDGNGIGFGKMDVTVVVVDYEIAKRVIIADLEDTEFARYLKISRIEMDRDDENQQAD